MKTNNQFVSVDWGTTNFRLRLVDRESQDIIFEFKSYHGVLTSYNDFLKQDALSQSDYFAQYLRSVIANIPHDIIHVPILLSGMSSSAIGMKELPYAEFPFNKSGESLIWEKLDLNNELTAILISGVKTSTGMMRGEEIQAIGLAEFMSPIERSILVLPGTHSKHLTYENGAFTELRNYMTGELFDVLSQKSILTKSVEKSEFDDTMKSHFLRGFDVAGQRGLSANLLSVRANDVIHKMPADQNYYFLSGLIIGAELNDLLGSNDNIYLAANEPILSLYKLALDHICSEERLHFFDERTLDKAQIKGHVKILEQYEKNSSN